MALLVFPSESCLRDVVSKLTDPSLAEAWDDDETIGWVYQDFHSEKERKKMRGGKNVPADGYALAVCAVVNAGPLRELFRHRDWSKLVNDVWTEVVQGQHDWSHVAKWVRPDAVLKRCGREKDLAIAHNRLDLYTEPAQTSRRGRKKAVQLALDVADEEEVDDD